MSSIPYDPELSRDNPSAKYKELLEEYIAMHQSATGMFDGKSLIKFIYIIDNFLRTNDCKTLLDYGAGKGTLYGKDFKSMLEELDEPLKDYWRLDEVDLYEPALPKYDVLPYKKYDAIICTDVLEHIPETDIGWVVDEIIERADKMVFFNIACYPALKTFTDGTNVHVSIFDPNDWLQFFKEKIKEYKDLSIYIFFDVMSVNHKTVTLEGFKVSHEPRVIQLQEQKEEK